MKPAHTRCGDFGAETMLPQLCPLLFIQPGERVPGGSVLAGGHAGGGVVFVPVVAVAALRGLVATNLPKATRVAASSVSRETGKQIRTSRPADSGGDVASG